ncbi:MAG: hypothetical protein CMP18_01015 [Rickettsiales bacterium]|jgi:ankyrin repeat protein|nr:hypothetical protein [Rickettsiales bacterium]|tara:strand:+ start:3012 stop:3221 length:210 start_codon:yes stop_codon:yes gene_type:complete
MNDRLETLELLIINSAKIIVTDNKGRIPLNYAESTSHINLEVVKFLLINGSNCKQINNDIITACYQVIL